MESALRCHDGYDLWALPYVLLDKEHLEVDLVTEGEAKQSVRRRG